MPDPASLNLATQVTGHQRFLFGSIAGNRVDRELIAAMDKLGDGMENLHFASGHPSESALQHGCFQYLRAEAQHSREHDLPHPSLLQSQFLVRLEASAEQSFLHFETQLRMLIEHRGGSVTTLAGVQRPRSYTSQAMTQFAYAGALQPGPGKQFPFAVVTPLNKTEEWWSMDWMRRESFFLPRYDPKGAVSKIRNGLTCGKVPSGGAAESRRLRNYGTRACSPVGRVACGSGNPEGSVDKPGFPLSRE